MNFKQYIDKNQIDLSKEDLSFELGNFITNARLYAGISQAELAKKMGTKQPSIARAENGTVTPSIDFLKRVTDSVGLTFVLPKIAEVERKNEHYNSHLIIYSANLDTQPITVRNIPTSFPVYGTKVSTS